METKTFKLEKSGYTAELMGYLSSRTSREYNKKVSSSSVLKIGEPDEKGVRKNEVEIREMPVSVLVEAQEYVLENILITLLDTDGVTKTFQDLLDLPTSDVNPLFDYADKLIKEGNTTPEEKKTGLVAASSSKKESAA